ncbi:hypothetical protein [Paenibacillus sp. SN-8-1]|uniref:hypothetical protein n=1 Tax=Paenibacillus sp. SN-8-1 TaxID=3435409 RepID=UPI003D9A7ED3
MPIGYTRGNKQRGTAWLNLLNAETMQAIKKAMPRCSGAWPFELKPEALSMDF